MEQQVYLQKILGTDKRNPVFTVYQDSKGEELHVYYGLQLFEVVRADKEDPAFKLLVGRLYNAGVKVKSLKSAFGVDRKTMKRWGAALRSGDPDVLVEALRGRGGHRKLTPEIESYVRMRFPSIYRETRYEYSKRVREEIAEVFRKSLSPETLRPLLHELKQQADGCPEVEVLDTEALDTEAEKRETACDEGSLPEEIDALPPANRQECPVSSPAEEVVLGGEVEARFCHHAGILVFSRVLVQVEQCVEPGGWLLKQWVAAILLGAVNIEQSKLLNRSDLASLLGRTLSSLGLQRTQLTELASVANVEQLLRLNGQRVGVEECRDFYYDPHAKHYTGMQHVLKGWCPAAGGVAKALYLDFIHTVGGHPVYVEHTDNYEDLRARFYKTAERFCLVMGLGVECVVTLTVDRGIYSHEVFEQFIESPRFHIITWQKGYRRVVWEDQQITGSFVLQRPRNNSTDLRTYRFEYLDRPWPRDGRMRQLRVQATNPDGRTVQVGVLTDDLERNAEEIVVRIFSRWIQENDFKYLDQHFGINEITSYASIAYQRLRDAVEERQMKSGEYKALEQERQAVRRELKKLLFDEHQHPGRNTRRQERIAELDQRQAGIEARMAQTEKESSRLDYVIEQQYVRLDTRNKKLMDVLKLIARNAFYDSFGPFKELYNNYRDDHVLFRNLTQAPGVLIERGDEVEVVLYPTPNYAPKVESIVKQFLADLTATGLLMPDGSGRRLSFRLGDKEGIPLAIAQPRNHAIY